MSDSTIDFTAARLVRRLRRVMAFFIGLLLLSTLPLWTPGTAFPDIPWLGWCCRFPPDPGEIAWLANLAVLLLLQFVDIRRAWLRRGLIGYFFLASVPLLLLLDQHRLQPWVWQMLLAGVLIGLSSAPTAALQRLRWLTLSIYVWSAVSKVDWAFVDGHGQVLLQGLTESIGLSTNLWSVRLRQLLALAFPLCELAVAVLLAVPRLWPMGRWGATLMHVALLLALGPTGLNHGWSVLVWNVFFIVNVWLLFGRSAAQGNPDAGPQPIDPDETPHVRPLTALTWLICLLPATSLVGLWDWWPSWAVYSSRPAIVQMMVHQKDVEHLPAMLQRHVAPPQPLSAWCPVNLDGWSYDTCQCPMYPQLRYRLAIIAALAESSDIDLQVTVRSSPDRWTGERIERTFSSDQLSQTLQDYWVNTTQRQGLTRREPPPVEQRQSGR